MILVLGLIYTFQTSLLDDFYKDNKIRSIETLSHTIVNNLDSEDLEDILDEASLNSDTCVRIVSESTNVMGYNKNNVCAIGRLTNNQIIRIEREVEDNGNSKLFTNYQFEIGPSLIQNIYIYAEKAQVNDEDILVLTSTNIAPLASTEATLFDQYKVLSVVVLLGTLVLAYVLSLLIVKPLKQIELESRNLPDANYKKDNVKAKNKETESLNDTLALANEEIKKADKAEKELIGNVSHDLRTPLTMIVGYGEMIRDLPEENNEENINVIIDEAKRLSLLVDDLLDVSKAKAGKVSLNKKDVSLNKLLKSVYKQYEQYCKNENIKLELKLGEDKLINVDELRIKQVLYNFINNAINYNNKSDKEIIIGVEKIDNKDRVYVYDNGQGIEDKDINNVWDRYYKVDKEHKRAHMGSGIGLSLSRELLKAHNLNYGVDSKLNEYSKFYFDI